MARGARGGLSGRTARAPRRAGAAPPAVAGERRAEVRGTEVRGAGTGDAARAGADAEAPDAETPDAGTPEDGAGATVRGLVGYQLRRAHTLFALRWQGAFPDGPHRVTPVQGGMLLTIAERPGLTQAALARLMAVEGPTLLQALDRLECNGLVRRERRADDRRSYALRLTPAGCEAVAEVRRFVPRREEEMLADLSPAERAQLLDLLGRVVRRGQGVVAAMAARPAAPPPPRPRRAAAAPDTHDLQDAP